MEDLINKIHFGNSENFLKKIEDDSIKLIVTSPPYWEAVKYEKNNKYTSGNYQTYLDSLLSIWKECERVLEPNGKLAINTPIMPIPQDIIKQDTRHIKNINNDIEHSILNETNLNLFSLYIWQKQTSKLMFGSYPYPGNLLENNTIEFINVYVKPGKSKKQPKKVKEANLIKKEEWIDLTQQVWFMIPDDVQRLKGHPAPFPEKLPARLIKMYTNGPAGKFQGDIVLDPFVGVGTTCVAAKKLDRQYIGVDIVKKYVDVAKGRVEKARRGSSSVYFIGRAEFASKKEVTEIQNEVLSKRKSKKNITEKIKSKHRNKKFGREAKNNNDNSSQLDLLEDI